MTVAPHQSVDVKLVGREPSRLMRMLRHELPDASNREFCCRRCVAPRDGDLVSQ